MMPNATISASILSADLGCLADDAKAALKAGADCLHIDVMDNQYVPNLSFGPLVCQALRKHLASAFLDVHLMVQSPGHFIRQFVQAGANQISFHPEASQHVIEDLQAIKQLGCQAGLAINPDTALTLTHEIWTLLDFLLIMSVNPGFSGQSFIPTVLDKLVSARQLIQRHHLPTRLGVDGGIQEKTIAAAAAAGADTFVVGSALFKSKDYAQTVTKLRAALPQPPSSVNSV